ncbi:MAG: M18 family aminopeptidase [Acidimicrobiia bacterium]
MTVSTEHTADDAEARRLISFIDRTPSPFHAVANVAAMLDDAGFTALDERSAWPAGAGRRYVVRGGALIAWIVPDGAPAHAPIRLAGAHTDSPNLRVKPNPDTANAGWRQLAVEVYGGVLLNSWLDRDLGLSGRVVLRWGEERLVKIDRPLLRVAQLAIHLDREVNERGLLLDKQAHLTPIWGLGAARTGEFAELLAETVEVDVDDIAAWDIMTHDLTPSSLLGLEREFIAAPRLDNLASVWCTLQALLTAAEAPGDEISMVCLFDHEEVGSDSTTGAGGPLLPMVVERITGGGESMYRALAGSLCVSADNAHAVHPNYVERHEPGHRPLPNAGPALKVNANQRYATSAVTAAAFVRACDAAGVPHQEFVSRNNMPCGSTIGPITATRLGIATVDVGVPQLSMHSARELAGVADPDYLTRALAAFYRGA